MIDDVGQRGAHRVAYLDYYELTTPTTTTTTNNTNNNTVTSPSSSSSSACCSSPFTPLLGLATIVSLTFYAIAKYR